jgi:hypothetical protein
MGRAACRKVNEEGSRGAEHDPARRKSEIRCDIRPLTNQLKLISGYLNVFGARSACSHALRDAIRFGEQVGSVCIKDVHHLTLSWRRLRNRTTAGSLCSRHDPRHLLIDGGLSRLTFIREFVASHQRGRRLKAEPAFKRRSLARAMDGLRAHLAATDESRRDPDHQGGKGRAEAYEKRKVPPHARVPRPVRHHTRLSDTLGCEGKIMAGRGPAPKNPDERRRRNADPVPTTTVAVDGQARGPVLPPEVAWPDATVRWWDTWRRSPQAQAFTSTDWDFLLDTALLHADYWNGSRRVAGELRLRVAKYGATPEDRARLRLQVERDGEESAPSPAAKPAGDRRARVLKVVTDGSAG